jgi:hypothetical protein
MKRIRVIGSLLAALAAHLSVAPDAHARADLDPAVNGLRIASGALRTFDFEHAEGLVGLQRASWVKTDSQPQIARTPIGNVTEATALLTTAAEDAVEGGHALRLGADGSGLAVLDAPLFAELASGRFEITFWARADGTAPQLQVFYASDPAAALDTLTPFAIVRGARTGRETSDGWAEYSTGPLDGQVWGVPVGGILLLPSYYAEATDSFLVDALEVRRVDGKPVAPVACNAQTVSTVCGAEGDCMYGRCVPSSVTWGALPTAAHRREIAERWITFGTRLIGDRNAALNGTRVLEPGARLLAETASSSRQFFGGLNRFVNLLRDNHTSFGSPSNPTSFAPQVRDGSSSVLGACFGVVDKDLLGGGLGYAVFRSTASPTTGVPLMRGDVLFAIDGRDPKEWVDEVWPQVATTLPNDPASDWGPSANSLSRLITTRANTVSILRCSSASDCSGAARQTLTIDVAAAAYRAVMGDVAEGVSRSFSCSQRFLDSVSVAPKGGNGEDPVATSTGTIGETRVQFDGFVGQSRWQASMKGVFANHPERVIMDARMGHGGYYTTVEYLFHLLRGTSEPMGVLSMGRGTYDLQDPPWLLQRLGTCAGNRGDLWACFQGNANGFYAKEAAPTGGATRIAWLNTYDVSANDFMPKLLKGRSGFQIFAPHPTSGAFGAISSLPSLWSGWSGGSLQVQDARFSTSLTGAGDARWESGHGVPPDVLVVEKLSDALAGVDTIVEAATQWLANP